MASALGDLARSSSDRRAPGGGAIAEELYISEKTSSVHATHLVRKVCVTSRVEAAAIAQRLGPGA